MMLGKKQPTFFFREEETTYLTHYQSNLIIEGFLSACTQSSESTSLGTVGLLVDSQLSFFFLSKKRGAEG